MPATFNPALPTVQDRLRFRLGDTNMDAPLLQDESYQGMLAYHGQSEVKALKSLAEALIARVAQDPDKADLGGGVGFEWRARLRTWREIADEAAALIAGVGAPAFAVSAPVRGERTAEYSTAGRVPW